MKRVFILAGETSGDLHGAALMRAMHDIEPVLEFRGIGGSRMAAEGLDPIRHVRDMHIMGFVEVVRRLPFMRRTFRDVERLLDDWRPDLAILIDYPGFNLRLAPRIARCGIPLMYYISPQLWAWHAGRVEIIRRTVDRMVVLFDFEREFYRSRGIEAAFVGHPLLDIVNPSLDRRAFRDLAGAGENVPVVGLLPGSREQEIERILPAMAGAAAILRNRPGGIVPVIGCAPELPDDLYRRHLPHGVNIPLLLGRTYDIMAHADALVVTSGTATLEAGILGTPMVIVYRTSPLTYRIGRALVRVPHLGMINIVAGERVVPELLQAEVTPERIAAEIAGVLDDPVRAAVIREKLAAAKARLGEPGAAGRAARIALDMIR